MQTTHQPNRSHRRPNRPRTRAFTLIEALVASALLGVIVLAVLSAVSASQRLGFEGQKQILAAIAADDLMGELVTLSYPEIKLKDGLNQPIGQIKTLDGHNYTTPYWPIGRKVIAKDKTISDAGLGTNIKGLQLIVESRDEFRTIVSVETFIPEPAP